MERSVSGVRSPLPEDQEDLTISSPSPRPIPPRHLAPTPVTLTVPLRESPTSSQDEVLLGKLRLLQRPQESRTLAERIGECVPTTPSYEGHSPSSSEVHADDIRRGIPGPEERERVRKACQAISRYREQVGPPLIPEFVKNLTDELSGFIYTVGRYHRDLDIVEEIGLEAWEKVARLRFNSQLMNEVEGFMAETPPYVSPLAPPRNLLQRIATPSQLTVSSDQDIPSRQGDPNHPGEGWMIYDPANPAHYPFVFANEEGRAETANYIKYATTGAEVQHLGTRRKGTTPYACPLHARAFPEPNFYKPGVKDTDLAIFYPDCTSRVIVDDALEHLQDPGVVADVYRLRAHVNLLERAKRQRTELDSEIRTLRKKILDDERYLVHASARSRLQDHLLRTRPSSPPTSFIPRIHAGQGPQDDEMDETDSLSNRAVTGKRKRGGIKPSHPYPCQWCLTYDHTEDDCPTPHFPCTISTCHVPTTHPNFKPGCTAWYPEVPPDLDEELYQQE